jgi:hypothetical protein
MLPIGEDRNCMHNSRMLWDLVNGLQIDLSVCRRSRDEDTRLFDFYYGLRFSVDRPSVRDEQVRRAQAEFPWDGVSADVFYCISHAKRVRINAHCNEQQRRRHVDSVYVRCTEMVRGTTCQPQDMFVYPGQELMGCSRGNKKILNGVTYIVTVRRLQARCRRHGAAVLGRSGRARRRRQRRH